MNKKSSFLIIFIVSFLFSQEEIIHISKTHPDGTPKEVIIYEIVNDDLKTDSPFQIINKIKYDSKGKYITPKLKGAAKMAERWIVGKWATQEMDTLNQYLQNNRDSSYVVYNDGEIIVNGKIYISEDRNQIILNYKKNDNDNWRSQNILFNNKNQFVLDGKAIFNRKH